MAPHPVLSPSPVDRFFSNYQFPILMSAFAAQVCHHQYIRRSEPALDYSVSVIRTGFPRPLRAGLGWAVVFAGLLTRITIAKIAIRDSSDPILAQPALGPWKKEAEQGL
jgi:hypothetical protein